MLNQKSTYSSTEKIEGELIHLLYSQSGSSIVASLFLAACLVFVLHSVTPNNILFGWFIAVSLIGVLRYSLVKIYLRKTFTPKENIFWNKLFIVMIGISALTWAFAGTVLIPEEGVYQTFIAFTLAGLTGGAIPFFAASRRACAAYTIPCLLPFAIWCFFQNNTPHRVLGFFILIYLFLLILTTFRTHKAVYNAIKLKFENDELVNSLSATKKDMEIINLELQNEINEKKIAEKLLRESEEQYRLVTDALPVLIAYIDTGLNYRFNNKSHEIWFDKPLNKITGKHIKEILDTTAYTIFLENYEKMQAKKQVSYETLMAFHDEEKYVSVTLIPHIKENQINGLFSLISDITPRINYLATHDALTDLPNRSFFNARFSQALKRANTHHYKVALLFLDLDHFKNINDTLGHGVGDNLLIKVVERIKSNIREVDILARQGGDEFTIILENITIAEINIFAKKICHAFSLPFHLDGQDIFITTSIGISLYPDDGQDMQILLKNADMAIYHAKEHGRNTFEFYTEDLNKKIVKKQIIQTNLRTALERNELLLHYQPVVDIIDNTLCGLEALIRWQHPEMGLIPPNDFIPIAEEIGLIVPIGEWIIRSACQQNLAWHTVGLAKNIRTSINLSARQFREKNLSQKITEILKETGLSAEYLTFELTETLIMQDIEYSAHVIGSLKDLGIAISIDDFGTGYSSLNYLRKFPIDILKIDRSFITDVITNSDDASIVRAIIALGHSLKMRVIAEGVETTEQYNFLKECNCNEIQGYLLSKPLPVVDATSFLQNTSSLEHLLKKLQANIASPL